MKNTFFKKDKIEHSKLSGILAYLIYIILFILFVIKGFKYPDVSGVIAFVIVLVIGLCWELLNMFLAKTTNIKIKNFFAKFGIHGTGFSVGDMIANTIGIAIGLFAVKVTLVIGYLFI